MPAAAVIPTLVMYFEVVAVKTLVVETGTLGGTTALCEVLGQPGSVQSETLPAALGGGHRCLGTTKGSVISFVGLCSGVGDREQIRMLNVGP